MYKIELLPTAWEDLDEIFDYISTYNPNSAEKTLDKIIKSLRRLEQFPNSGTYAPDIELKKYGFRMVISSPYISFYRFIEDKVFIYHVVHGSKNYSKILKKYIEE